MGDGTNAAWSSYYLLDVQSKESRLAFPIRCITEQEGDSIQNQVIKSGLSSIVSEVDFDNTRIRRGNGALFVCKIPALKPHQGNYATQKIYLREEKNHHLSLRRTKSLNRGLSIKLTEITKEEAEKYSRAYGFTRQFY